MQNTLRNTIIQVNTPNSITAETKEISHSQWKKNNTRNKRIKYDKKLKDRKIMAWNEAQCSHQKSSIYVTVSKKMYKPFLRLCRQRWESVKWCMESERKRRHISMMRIQFDILRCDFWVVDILVTTTTRTFWRMNLIYVYTFHSCANDGADDERRIGCHL